ncbi:MAG: glucosidase, partial [Chthoniobacteraceae bacterium]
MTPHHTPEQLRLDEDSRREKNWKRWGPYISERQWGTVREDYSPNGDAWNYLTHDRARSQAYRWGEDGLFGITDRECRLCFALALWNGRDPFLKERLFGVSNPQGNHGEDVKEWYWYLDSTPTHSYMRALYKYPQAEFPYQRLVEENGRRSKQEEEFELQDTGIFNESRYFDVLVEYAKGGPDDILVRLTISNRGPEAATIHVLPTLWYRNVWSWDNGVVRPGLECVHETMLTANHATLGRFQLETRDPTPWLFTENDSNLQRLYGCENPQPFVKDAFHEYVVGENVGAVNPAGRGTKAAAHFIREIPAGGDSVIELRLRHEESIAHGAWVDFDKIFTQRRGECDAFYDSRLPSNLYEDQRRVVRQAYAGLLWTKQYFEYVVKRWLEGDPAQPPPPPERLEGRNSDWPHLYNSDVISMPDKWEYPWYAAWDLAFHMMPFSRLDRDFAKGQLQLFLREWYMHPNGQIPAYEWNFSDVNPPVHAWSCWRTYKISAPQGKRDTLFLERCFQKLLLNFNWWVNRKDTKGKHIFGGGFLGLDNIGLFDRSTPLPGGHQLQQADGTAWMAFFCATMLAMALELARTRPAYEDIAS